MVIQVGAKWVVFGWNNTRIVLGVKDNQGDANALLAIYNSVTDPVVGR